MKIDSYRRKDKGFYEKLQAFLDDLGEQSELEVPNIYEILGSETGQIEKLTYMAIRKMRFEDQFNYQAVTQKIADSTATLIGTKGIKGQPRRVQWGTSDYFAVKQWDWRPVREQTIEVIVQWTPAPTGKVEVTLDVWGD